MRRAVIAYAALVAACQSGGPEKPPVGDGCAPSCGDGLVCRYATCIAPPVACTANAACPGDEHCDTAASECVPWGLGPGGASDPSCQGAPAPGVFFPAVQCAWLGPPAGDPYPMHTNVLAAPMVAAFEAEGPASIVFTSYNFTDYGSPACGGSNPADFGVIRLIDGRTCAPQATIASPSVIGSASLAIGDLGGDDATPEIVAARTGGGLVAFTRKSTGWEVLWQTAPPFPTTPCDWAGPSIHDLDDDGAPEVIFYGAVYNGQTGATIDDSVASTVDATGVGYVSVVADVDGDGVPDLITGSRIYAWDKAARRWTAQRDTAAANGAIAVGDFGTFPADGQPDRSHTDGIAETVVVMNGVVHVFTVAGAEVFKATLQGVAMREGPGGTPVVADFDGDGRLEIGVAGATAYNVLDPDCNSAPNPATCAAMTTNGVLWATPVTGTGIERTGSSAFDFDGDGRAEVVAGDRCFSRVYDGRTGAVLYSRARTSCTWYEHPVVADTDGDSRAELVTTSNTNCGSTCPAIDPQFAGLACVDDTDCPSRSATPMACVRDQASDARGRCRCHADADCGDGLVCGDHSSPGGHVCLAAHGTTALAGVQVLGDALDRWTTARPIWNQDAYSVTNIDDDGGVPRTSAWLRNWTEPGLNSFRANAHASAAITSARPDLTVKQAKVTCDPAAPTVSAEICNRGSAPVAGGVPVAVYAQTTPTKLRCQSETAAPLAPGGCTTVSCAWIGPSGDGAIVVDDRGDGLGIARECREDNNVLAVHVGCAGPPG
jgi:hypothetical protein